MTDTEVSREVLAAVKPLAARGELSAASMADIASEAGITRVTLYRRGETRPAIIAALRDELLREERELLLPLLGAGRGAGAARGGRGRLLPLRPAAGKAGPRLTRVWEGVCAPPGSPADLLAGL